jgi:hypothetical protein
MHYMSIICATLEVESGRIMVWGQPRQKVQETSSQSRSLAWWFRSVVWATREACVGWQGSEVGLGQNCKTLPAEKLKQKRTGGVAQVVEHLSSKHKVLSLNASIAKKKKERKKCVWDNKIKYGLDNLLGTLETIDLLGLTMAW